VLLGNEKRKKGGKERGGVPTRGGKSIERRRKLIEFRGRKKKENFRPDEKR